MKGVGDPVAPLGELLETTEAMQITSIGICGSYPVTSRQNKCLLTFIIFHVIRKLFLFQVRIRKLSLGHLLRRCSRHGCPQVLS
jgi:hypothetical protein